jgi:hypothetical protein
MINEKIRKKFWEELIAYFPLRRHGSHRKRRLQQFFVAAGMSLPSCYLATIGRTQTDPQTRVQQFFVAVGTCLPSCYLATIGGTQTDPQTRVQQFFYCCLCRWDEVRCHDIHTKFHRDWLRHSEVNRGDTPTVWRPHKQTRRRGSFLALPSAVQTAHVIVG